MVEVNYDEVLRRVRQAQSQVREARDHLLHEPVNDRRRALEVTESALTVLAMVEGLMTGDLPDWFIEERHP